MPYCPERCVFCRECAIKFNDYFEFPREFDMEPYTVQGLAKIEGKFGRFELEYGCELQKEEENACTSAFALIYT
jgi:hypothetical protein